MSDNDNQLREFIRDIKLDIRKAKIRITEYTNKLNLLDPNPNRLVDLINRDTF